MKTTRRKRLKRYQGKLNIKEKNVTTVSAVKQWDKLASMAVKSPFLKFLGT